MSARIHLLASSIALSLAAAVVCAAPAAHAYPLYWIGTQLRGTSQAWQYSGKGSDGQPWSNAHSPADKVHEAITATFVAFQKGNVKDAAGAACSYLDFTDTTPEAGTSARLDQEGTWTEGIFVSRRTDPIYQYMQGGVVAFALPAPDPEGYVSDCDTVYNAVDVPFATDGSNLSLQGIGMQETAHCFGLHHVCQQSPGDGQPPCDGVDVDTHSVMFPFADPHFGADQPDGRDQDNMCQIYPVNGIGRPCDPSSTGPQGEPVGFITVDCQEGTTCACTPVGQICTKTCAADTECPAGSRCDTGSCVPNFYPGTEKKGVPTRTGFTCDTTHQLHKPIGSACGADADCGQGEVCLTTVGGGTGYCSADCTSGACPPDGECVSDVLHAGDAYCLKPCSFKVDTCETTECGQGQVCAALGGGNAGVCFDGCKTDADCDSATPPLAVCDTATGMCHSKRTAPVCGPHHSDVVPPVCIPICDGAQCGAADGCGGTCGDGSGCIPPPVVPPTPPTKEKTGGCASFDASALALAALALRRRRLAAVVWPLAAAGVLALGGCSAAPPPENAADGGTADAGVTAANFRDEKAQAYCEYAKRCTPVLEHYRCAPSTSTIGDELSAGRVGFDPAAAEQCVDGVRSADCQPDPFTGSQLAAASACDLATPPKLDDGASCFDDRDCTGGWCNTGGTCPGVCAKAAQPGEACGKTKCAKGSYCSPRSNKCTALLDGGANCFFDQQCATGFCKVNLATQTGRCAAPKGASAGREGAVCTAYGDCLNGLYCAFDPSTLDGQQIPTGKCRPQIAPGVACGADGDPQGVTNACAQGYACTGFSMPSQPSLHNPQLPGVCLPYADVGQACTPIRAGAAVAVTGCMYGLVCGSDGKCALPVAGNACGIDQYSGCVVGETCDDRQGKCVAYGEKGSQCFFDTQCVSGSCVGGRCTAPCKAE